MSQDSLLLKWGTLKGWNCQSDAAKAALRAYAEAGEHSASAILQHDTPDMKEALCRLIDAIDGEITNDWSGDQMSKDEAKDYVRNYGAGR